MRGWMLSGCLVFLLTGPAAADGPNIDFDGSGGGDTIGVGKFHKSQDTEPPSREDRSDVDTSSAPARPSGPSQRDLQRSRWAADLIRQGDNAFKRRKYAEALAHYKNAADLGTGGAWTHVAAAQHQLGLLWFKQKQYLAGRWKVEEAIRTDPNQPAYQQTLSLMHEKWCRLNKPVVPVNLTDNGLGFQGTAEAICQEKANLATRGGWQCDWIDSCW